MRVILHCDMNSFYASVEMLYQPHLRTVPLAVGGDESKRHGIVLAKNEWAKARGVQTGEPLFQSRQKCPQLVVVPPHYDRYHRISNMANEIYHRYSDRVEPFSIDESWIDLTGCVDSFAEGVQMAEEIRRTIERELGVTVSIGVSYNKIFAKLGSELKKPNAVTALPPSSLETMIWPLSPRALLFIGPATEKKLARIGIHTIGDLARAPETTLRSLLGKWGHTLRQYALGHEYAPVARWGDSPVAKSIGNSTTLPKNLVHAGELVPIIYMLCECVAERLRLAHLRAEVLHLWLRDSELSSQTRQIHLGAPTQVSSRLASACFRLIRQHWDGSPIRSVGVQVSQLSFEKEAYQLSIFSMKEQKKAELERCIDTLRHRFGHWCIARAVTLQDTQLKIDPLEENSLHSVAFRKGAL